ncbi:MAG TPA: GGDEF domain-containing protein [Gemmatimonadaceae bacterium]|nr:GGDEF domain-containing protein [Gemmatimonadaceae bacterium]
MTRTPTTTVRVSERLTPLRGIAAIDAQGSENPIDGGERRTSAWSRFWNVTDPALRDAGINGERLIAKYRLALALLLFGIPVRSVLTNPGLPQNWVGFAISLAGVIAGVAFLWLTQRDTVRVWTGFAASLLDVSFVSTGLAAFVSLGVPQIAVNSRVIFEVYFLCLGLTCLRYDRRICLVTGITAMLQYACIVAWASTTIDTSPAWADLSYGRFDVQDQMARIVLLGIATCISLAIVLRVQQLRVLSVRDRLTGLMIRGYFDERLSESFDRAQRTGDALAVAMIDLDHFKTFNDRFGHAVGDLVLASVSRAIRQLVRAEDVVGRYGGEELIVMLPGLDIVRATERMERIRRAISKVRVELDGRTAPLGGLQSELFGAEAVTDDGAVLTCSIGVASWPEDRAETVEALVYRADSRLLSAKSTGRNRVVSSAGATDEFAVLSFVKP